MKNQFVKITLILSMLLVMAIPTQAFAAEQTCTLDSTNASKINISKIYGQVSQETINKIKSAVAECTSGKIDPAQLQNILKQLGVQTTVTTPTKSTTATTPAKQTATTPATAPAKPTATTTPAKSTTPATPAKQTTTTPAKQTTTTNATPSTTQTTTSNSASLGSYEQQVVDLVNKERAAAGLPALKVNTNLAAVAEKKAEDMRDKNYFSHTSPTYGSPFDMMKQFGISYTAAGENIAKGQKTPEAVMNGWMNSEGHRANIMNANYTEIGVGYVTDSNGTTYWVQEFIRP